jgi:hypothetical protein
MAISLTIAECRLDWGLPNGRSNHQSPIDNGTPIANRQSTIESPIANPIDNRQSIIATTIGNLQSAIGNP